MAINLVKPETGEDQKQFGNSFSWDKTVSDIICTFFLNVDFFVPLKGKYRI